MDVRRLQYFVGVAAVGSINAAAQAMSISQPSLSRHIKLLEEDLGIELFHRLNRGVKLNAQGEELLARIGKPLKQIERSLRAVRALGSDRRAPLTLWMPTSVANVLAVPLTRRLADEAPELEVRIASGPPGGVGRRGALDLAIVSGSPSFWERMGWTPLFRHMRPEELLVEDMILVGSAASGLDPNARLGLDALDDLPLVWPSPENQPQVYHVILQEIARLTAKPPKLLMISDSVEQALEIVKSGRGFTIAPVSAVTKSIVRGELSCSYLADPAISRALILMTRADAAGDGPIARTKTLLLAEIDRLVTSGDWPVRTRTALAGDPAQPRASGAILT